MPGVTFEAALRLLQFCNCGAGCGSLPDIINDFDRRMLEVKETEQDNTSSSTNQQYGAK